MQHIAVTVDGTHYESDVEPRTLLVHWLRNDLGKVGTVVGLRHLQLRCLHRAAWTDAA